MTKLRIPPEVLNALEAQVERTSLRKTAAALGLSPTGLSMVLAGRPAQNRTLRKVMVWFADSTREGSHPAETTIQATLRLLVDHLPESHRERTIHAMLEQVRRASEEASVRAPAWTNGLQA